MENVIEITSGLPAAAELTRAARLARRAALNLEDAERALTYLIAHLSGLAVDETLFRREFPAELLDAASVRLTGETTDPSPNFRSFTALLSAREVARGEVTAGVLAALGKLPCGWLTVAGGRLAAPVTMAELKPLRSASFGSGAASGRRVATVEAELAVRICTSPPR